MAAMAVMDHGRVVVVVGCLSACSGIIHRPVRVHLFPHIIVRPRNVMVHPIFCEEYIALRIA